MEQRFVLQVKGVAVEGGSNLTNPLGLRIRLDCDHDGRSQPVRMYFYHPDTDQPTFLGWRALLDGAFVLFLQRRDYGAYLTLLHQVRASHLKIWLDEEDSITGLYLSTDAVELGRSEAAATADHEELRSRRARKTAARRGGAKRK